MTNSTVKEPRTIISGEHRIYLNADRDMFLWCHPGNIGDTYECGQKAKHCEVTITLGPRGWSARTTDPLTITGGYCIACSACGQHAYILEDVVYVVVTKKNRDGWNAYYKALAEFSQKTNK